VAKEKLEKYGYMELAVRVALQSAAGLKDNSQVILDVLDNYRVIVKEVSKKDKK